MLERSTGSVFADLARLGEVEHDRESRVAKAHVMAGLFGTEPRQRLGRYELQARIGEGAHGHVYRAFDPRLRRHVAIKVLRPSAGGDPLRLRRMRSEAHALARLQHPGVVAVYDVGIDEAASGEHALYIVMELVDGLDLAGWLAARRRPWPEVLSVALSAGQGLAAAHRAGLVHRDMKPGNVLVGPDGAAKVADFGLAAQAGLPSTARTTAREPDVRVTATGAVLGTPLYMPPEQHEGGSVDARADQYAFCVATWEALYGASPFAGSSIEAVQAAKLGGPPSPPTGSDVPPAIGRVLARGLAVEPASRYRDMDALLEALRAASPRARRRRMVLGAAVGLAIMASSALWWGAPAPCDPELATWREESGDPIEAAFLATGRTDAAERAQAILHALDGWHARWGEASCAGAEGASSPVATCLSLAWDERTALLSVLADADARVVGRAVAAVASLPAPEDCTAGRPLPESVGPKAAQESLARARALQAAGRDREARELVRGVLDGLHRDDPLWLEAAFRMGRLEHLTGEGVAARTFEDVYHEAIAREDASMAAASGAQLLQIHARADHMSEAERWDRHTEAALARAGDPDHVRLVWLHGRGMLAQKTGRADDAIAAYGEAAFLAERIGAGEQAATSLGMRGLARRDLGELSAAEADLRRALELREAFVGTDDPRILGVLQNLASVLTASGDHAHARELLERARALVSRHRGPDGPEMIEVLELLGLSALAEGDLERAAAHFSEVLAARERDADTQPRRLAHACFNLGNVEALRGDLEAAAAHHAAALRWLEEAVGPEHPEIAFVLTGLADVQRERGDLQGALALLERAEAQLQDARVPDTRRAELWSVLATALFAAGRDAEARAVAERAIAVFEAAGPVHEDQAETLRVLMRENAPG